MQIVSWVRKGSGSSAWVAEITGISDRFGLERRFIEPARFPNRLVFELPDGVFEFRGVQPPPAEAGVGCLRRGFVRVDAGVGAPVERWRVESLQLA